MGLDLYVGVEDEWFEFRQIYESVVILIKPFLDACFVILNLFLPWVCVHSYRLTDPQRWRFYRGKLAIFGVYFAWTTVSFHIFHVGVNYIPFTTIICGIRLYFLVGKPTEVLIASLVTTAIEFLIVLSILCSMSKTASALRRANYVQLRLFPSFPCFRPLDRLSLHTNLTKQRPI